MTKKSKLEKRLSSYWKLELGNVVLVPAAMIFLAAQAGSPIGWLSLFAIIPMCGLLLIGGLYWRGKYWSLKGNPHILPKALRLAHIAQIPLLILTVMACGLTLGATKLAVGTGDLIVSVIAAVLALLEYINYYHRQIQHFDHLADFKRLMSGRGFRRSQMSQDLKAWRRQQRRAASA